MKKNEEFVEKTLHIVGKDNISTSDIDVSTTVDVTTSSLGEVLKNKKPIVVVRPRSTREVSEILKLANLYLIPIVPISGATNVVGGSSPLKGCVMMDLTAMNNIIKIDKENMLVVTQPGVVLSKLEIELNKNKLILDHNPGSVNSATIGGAVSTNGIGDTSGIGGIAYNILGIEVVLPTGVIIKTKPVTRSTTGKDTINWLFIGMEGTMGVITELTIRVESYPEAQSTHIVGFPSWEKAANVGWKIAKLGIFPHSLNIVERNRAVMSASILKERLDIGAVLVLHFRGAKEIVIAQSDRAINECIKEGGLDLGFEVAEEWWKNRHGFGRVSGDLTDHGRHNASFAEFSNYIKMYKNFRELTEKYRLQYVGAILYGGRGWSMNQIAAYDARNKSEIQRYKKYDKEMIESQIKLGGTVDAAHGFGNRLPSYMQREYGSSFEVLKKIKKVLDPKNILNPGKKGF